MTDSQQKDHKALYGQSVSLVPLSRAHANGLKSAVMDGDVSGTWCAQVPSPSAMEQEIERRLALHDDGKMLPYTVLDHGDAICGMTSLYDIDWVNHTTKLGYTWYAASAQGTHLNKEAKLLLLQLAFESFGFHAVYITTHRLNFRSRKAIESLGARLDGILRNHMKLADGTLRDTCWYSIVESEWPAIKNHLQWRIGR